MTWIWLRWLSKRVPWLRLPDNIKKLAKEHLIGHKFGSIDNVFEKIAAVDSRLRDSFYIGRAEVTPNTLPYVINSAEMMVRYSQPYDRETSHDPCLVLRYQKYQGHKKTG